MSNNRVLTEEQQFYRRLNIGDVIWRPATVHAETGLMPHDVDVREQPPTNIGNQVVFGYVVYAISGDLERLGVLPNSFDFKAKDKALRLCTNWIENDRKPGEFIGMRVFLPDLPPPGWTHVVVDRVQRITLDQATNKGYFCYYGRWESDPARFATRYYDAYVADLQRSSNGRQLSKNARMMERVKEMYDLDKVNMNLGIDNVFLTSTPANTVEAEPAPPSPAPEANELVS